MFVWENRSALSVEKDTKVRSGGRLPRRNGSKERGKASEACSNRLATLNKHVRLSEGVSMERGSCWTAKRGSFGAKIRERLA